MGSIPAELSLDLMPGFVPKSISDFLKEISPIGNVSERKEKVGDYVKRLEDEMKKVDAFRRELPLCMLLLTDAIQFLKDQWNLCSEPNVQPVLEEFIPLKKDLDGDTEINQEKSCTKDKMNWMSSVQLWKSDVQIKQRNVEENHPASEDLSQSSKTKTEGGTFFPFKGQSSCPVTAVAEEDKEGYSPVSVLSLLTPGTKTLREESGSSGLSSKPSSTRAVSSNLQVVPQSVRPRQQESRKQRRCWSPELHQRFINALKQLGGSQVATPKQIRELMQVDGLTNDEVKSHLQKYRLHNRRMSTIASSIPSNRPVVVFGGLWISQNQYANSSKASSSQSDSPQSPLQLTGNTGGTSADSMGDEEDELHSQQTWKG